MIQIDATYPLRGGWILGFLGASFKKILVLFLPILWELIPNVDLGIYFHWVAINYPPR